MEQRNCSVVTKVLLIANQRSIQMMSAISNCFSCKQTAIENLILYGIPTSLVLTDLFYENLPEYVLYAAMLVPMAYKFGGDLADSATSDKTLSSRIAEAFKRQLCSKEILFSLTLLSMHHLGKNFAFAAPVLAVTAY